MFFSLSRPLSPSVTTLPSWQVSPSSPLKLALHAVRSCLSPGLQMMSELQKLWARPRAADHNRAGRKAEKQGGVKQQQQGESWGLVYVACQEDTGEARRQAPPTTAKHKQEGQRLTLFQFCESRRTARVKESRTDPTGVWCSLSHSCDCVTRHPRCCNICWKDPPSEEGWRWGSRVGTVCGYFVNGWIRWPWAMLNGSSSSPPSPYAVYMGPSDHWRSQL